MVSHMLEVPKECATKWGVQVTLDALNCFEVLGREVVHRINGDSAVVSENRAEPLDEGIVIGTVVNPGVLLQHRIVIEKVNQLLEFGTYIDRIVSHIDVMSMQTAASDVLKVKALTAGL